MLTNLDELLSSYNLDDVAYRAKFKDADTSVCKKRQIDILHLFQTKKKRKEYCSNR